MGVSAGAWGNWGVPRWARLAGGLTVALAESHTGRVAARQGVAALIHLNQAGTGPAWSDESG
jgi:hypothetical protein